MQPSVTALLICAALFLTSILLLAFVPCEADESDSFYYNNQERFVLDGYCAGWMSFAGIVMVLSSCYGVGVAFAIYALGTAKASPFHPVGFEEAHLFDDEVMQARPMASCVKLPREFENAGYHGLSLLAIEETPDITLMRQKREAGEVPALVDPGSLDRLRGYSLPTGGTRDGFFWRMLGLVNGDDAVVRSSALSLLIKLTPLFVLLQGAELVVNPYYIEDNDVTFEEDRMLTALSTASPFRLTTPVMRRLIRGLGAPDILAPGLNPLMWIVITLTILSMAVNQFLLGAGNATQAGFAWRLLSGGFALVRVLVMALWWPHLNPHESLLGGASLYLGFVLDVSIVCCYCKLLLHDWGMRDAHEGALAQARTAIAAMERFTDRAASSMYTWLRGTAAAPNDPPLPQTVVGALACNGILNVLMIIFVIVWVHRSEREFIITGSWEEFNDLLEENEETFKKFPT